jgi:hypothetical protein
MVDGWDGWIRHAVVHRVAFHRRPHSMAPAGFTAVAAQEPIGHSLPRVSMQDRVIGLYFITNDWDPYSSIVGST